ncbi:DNA polymerase [Clostridium oceanicum]|uniref:DNA-directed DNA polymerase n=1 Tax=Clostridium oceanicum TaxID=1543 RepID=A0ABN1JK99_9CLOT
MKILAIDIETYSSKDITKCGVYAYTEAEDFDILLFAYAYDKESVEIIDLASGEKLPQNIIDDLTNEEVIKTAFNANFERTCLSKYLDRKMEPNQWRCTAVHALELGLPGSLDKVSKSLNLKEEKMGEGKSLIRYFCMPSKPTKANGFKYRNIPIFNVKNESEAIENTTEDSKASKSRSSIIEEKWNTFKAYCKRDVEVERAIRNKLNNFKVHKREWKLWNLDQKINDYGVRVDKALVYNAIKCDSTYREKRLEEAKNLTGLQNPNSPEQLKEWLESNGVKVESLTKESVKELLEKVEDERIKRVLHLRLSLSKTSVKKYEAMKKAMGKDERVRGLMKFYGANRTGRWSGKLVQTQNLPRNNIDNLDEGREILKAGDFEMLELLFENVPEVLSQIIRTAFIPSHNSRFIVSDFSAIEARVIAWLAGETWVLDAFKSHGKIYEMTASKMFRVPLYKIEKGNPEYSLRQKGKIATLACGYQGSVGALKAMGALKMGLYEDELLSIVTSWRKSNPKIVNLWRKVEKAAIKSVEEDKKVKIQQNIEFSYTGGILFVKLPSGRKLSYVRPRIELDYRFNTKKLTYEGVKQVNKKWGRLETYGGKLTENIVQAIARDCLGEAMLRLDKRGYKIVFHVHDEIILDCPKGFGSLDEVNKIMAEPIDWAKGLPLKADGFEGKYYRK